MNSYRKFRRALHQDIKFKTIPLAVLHKHGFYFSQERNGMDKSVKVLRPSSDNYVWYGAGGKTQGWNQTAFKTMDLEAQKQFIERYRNTDTYISINEFKDGKTRARFNVALLRAFVIDIDAHTLAGMLHIKDAQNMTEYLQDHFNKTIPEPSRIVYSGRGIHLYWNLAPTTEMDKYDLVIKAIYKKVDKLIYEYNPLTNVYPEADKHFKDAAQANSMIRKEGTYNTQANTYATCIYEGNKTYSLDQLIDAYVPELTIIKHNKPVALQTYNEANEITFRQYRKEFTLKTLLYAVIEDLFTIAKYRAGMVKDGQLYKRGSNVGKRNYMLFYFGLYCRLAYQDSQQVLDSMLELNKCYLNEELSERELYATYNSIVKNTHYKRPLKSTIINKLGISAQEMQLLSLKVLIDRDEIKRRTCQRVKVYKQNKAIVKHILKDATIHKVKELRAAGMSIRAIAKELQMSDKTVQKYLKV